MNEDRVDRLEAAIAELVTTNPYAFRYGMNGPVAQIVGDVRNPRPAAADVPGPADRPPTGGPGSSLAAWRAYAEQIGIEVPEDASKTDVQHLVDSVEMQAV